jgi:hypothetical protein
MCYRIGVVEINGSVPMCGVLWPVCILQHLTVGYQCVACCDQSAYCNIWQLGTNVWRVVTSLHIVTSDRLVAMCGVLWPICTLQHLTKVQWKNVQYFLRIEAQLCICMFVKFCDILPPKYASYLISSVAEEFASWTVYSEMCLCPSVCCILKFIYIFHFMRF